jgi:hypothetical protein
LLIGSTRGELLNIGREQCQGNKNRNKDITAIGGINREKRNGLQKTGGSANFENSKKN